MIRQHHEIIRQMSGFVKFISDDWGSSFRGADEFIVYPRTLLDLNRFPRFSGNAVRHVFCGYMVTYISLQLAYFMGFERVYLLGADFDYSLSHDGADTIVHAAGDPSDISRLNISSRVNNVMLLRSAGPSGHALRSFMKPMDERLEHPWRQAGSVRAHLWKRL
jgi:hypothetical protein